MKLFLSCLITTFVIFNQVNCNEILASFVEFHEKFPDVKISEKCYEDLKILKSGIENEEVWSLLVQDLSGKPSPGFLWGNNFWLGARDSCTLMNDPPKIPLRPAASRKMIENVTDVRSVIEVEYRVLYVNHTSNLQFDVGIFKFFGLHIGLCFPTNCNQNDTKVMSEKIFNSNSSKRSIFGNLQFVKTKVLNLRDKVFEDPAVVILT